MVNEDFGFARMLEDILPFLLDGGANRSSEAIALTLIGPNVTPQP